jgi:DNA-binding transcriptional LysR family regulator
MTSSTDVAVFVRTIDLGSFAAAGSEFRITASGASRVVSRLEKQLGVKLLHRSTRRLVLSPEGETYLPHARAILATIEQAEAAISRSKGKPSGTLRINTGTALARRRLTALLPEFMARYPEIAIELTVTDRRVDPIADRIDVTIRVAVGQRTRVCAPRRSTARHRCKSWLFKDQWQTSAAK